MKWYKCLWLLLFFPWSAQAVGLSVSPSTLDLLSPDISYQEIVVKNISAEPILVKVYADDFQDNISISPQEFELLPEQLSPVKISANFNSFSPGIKKTNISVLSQAKDKRSFNAISGIKIPTNIYINETYFNWSGPAVFVAVFFGLLFIWGLSRLFLIIFAKKPKKRGMFSVDFLFHHKKKWYKWW